MSHQTMQLAVMCMHRSPNRRLQGTPFICLAHASGAMSGIRWVQHNRLLCFEVILHRLAPWL